MYWNEVGFSHWHGVNIIRRHEWLTQRIKYSLAYLEIYTTMALFFSRFDMILDYPAPGKELEWSDCLARRSKDFIKVRIIADKFSS